MRLMYLVTRGDSIGGAQVHVRDLAIHCRSLGDDVVVVIGVGGPLTDQLAAAGIRTMILPGMLREISPHKDIGAIRAFREIVRREQPDLISTHSSKAGIIGRIGAKWAGTPAIFTAHGWAFTGGVPQPKRTMYRLVERAHERLAAKIICVSEHDREIGIAAGMSADRLVTIHNGMPDVPQSIRANPVRQDQVRAVMIARFDRQKDHDTLLRALVAVPDLHLDLIGHGPGQTDTELLISRLDLGRRVHMHGQHADVATILADAQMFVLSSHWEGFPRSTLEAMRAGLPVVVSRVGGAAEAVVDGETGFVVNAVDRDQLAARLRDLQRDPALRTRMGSAARARYEAKFTFAHMFAKTRQVYEDVTSPDALAN